MERGGVVHVLDGVFCLKLTNLLLAQVFELEQGEGTYGDTYRVETSIDDIWVVERTRVSWLDHQTESKGLSETPVGNGSINKDVKSLNEVGFDQDTLPSLTNSAPVELLTSASTYRVPDFFEVILILIDQLPLLDSLCAKGLGPFVDRIALRLVKVIGLTSDGSQL
jgi:hypothetical protein